MKKLLQNNSGATFIELLLYITVFLILTPVLLTVSINSITTEQQHTEESEISTDSRFVIERTYDLITSAKKINVSESRLNDENGRLSIVMQDDSSVIIELNESSKKIEITEDGTTSNLSSNIAKVERLYFTKITDQLNDPDIILGVNMRLQISGLEEYDILQNYVISANLERGDYDEDGCPDFIDKFPKHPDCCGDADNDDVCDEMDNCIFEYNPFQEDYDVDDIGDLCDSYIFFEGGDGGNSSGGLGPAYNCSPDDKFIALINQDPSMKSSSLKQILLSASPLSPNVLQALIDAHPLLTNGHFRQIFVKNTILPGDILDNVVEMDLPVFHRVLIIGADLAATYIPWLGVDRSNTVEYLITLYSDAPEEEYWNNRINFHDADVVLGSELETEKTDVFLIDVTNGSDSIIVTTETTGGIEINTVDSENNYIRDANGYAIEFDGKSGDSYSFLISSAFSDEALISVEFDFGEGADITSPIASEIFESSRYICYCSGGCAEGCGDIGTGILTTHLYTDSCYTEEGELPEWCSHWYTFEDDNTENPAYIGGTSEVEESIYWEKGFTTVLNQLQQDEIDSITVGGEVAYQSVTQFFCDTLSSSCPMNGELIGLQDIELYNWDSHEWEIIGNMNLDDSTSDQQVFEVLYDNIDVLKFLGGRDDIEIRARMNFKWNGINPQGEESAPSFMLIDYFTIHLKW